MFKKIFKNKDAEKHDDQPKNMPNLVKTEELEKKVNSLLFISRTFNSHPCPFLTSLAFHYKHKQHMGL